jgi:surface polysaccharide O-acyltransferase-like enzyme
MQTETERESNFELLRLVCMGFILILHAVGALKILGISVPGTAFYASSLCAVNCFVLVSGYFGVTVKWKGFVRLYLFCFFYTFCSALLASLFHHELYLKRIVLSLFVFSRSPAWFVNVYFALYMLSPFLNKMAESLRKKDFLIFLAVLTFVNVYMGFYCTNARINQDGYNIMHFIYIYFIGKYIHAYCPLPAGQKIDAGGGGGQERPGDMDIDIFWNFAHHYRFQCAYC